MKKHKSNGETPFPIGKAFEKPVGLVFQNDNSPLQETRLNESSRSNQARSLINKLRIPDWSNYGDPGKVRPGDLLDYFIQHHDSRGAGSHYDLRAGTPDTGLYSWATKKELPEPGAQPIALYSQPVHAYDYGSFSGEIGHGYRHSSVQLKKTGKLLITGTTRTTIHFSTAGPSPQVKRFCLVKPQRRHDSWLLLRAQDPGLDPETAESVLRDLQDDVSVSAMCGAIALIRIAKHRAELVLCQISRDTGRAIPLTEKFFHCIPRFHYPGTFENALLTSEILGERGGTAISIQELDGILNAGIARSLEKQKAQKVDLKSILFGVKEMNGKPVNLPHHEQRRLLKELLPYLPRDKFLLSENARAE